MKWAKILLCCPLKSQKTGQETLVPLWRTVRFKEEQHSSHHSKHNSQHSGEAMNKGEKTKQSLSMLRKFICNLKLQESASFPWVTALGGVTHLSWVSVVTGLKQHQASFLAGAALGHQAFVGLQVVELQKKTALLRLPCRLWCRVGGRCCPKSQESTHKPRWRWQNKTGHGDLGLSFKQSWSWGRSWICREPGYRTKPYVYADLERSILEGITTVWAQNICLYLRTPSKHLDRCLGLYRQGEKY